MNSANASEKSSGQAPLPPLPSRAVAASAPAASPGLQSGGLAGEELKKGALSENDLHSASAKEVLLHKVLCENKLVKLAQHYERFPSDGIDGACANVFTFDAFDGFGPNMSVVSSKVPLAEWMETEPAAGPSSPSRMCTSRCGKWSSIEITTWKGTFLKWMGAFGAAGGEERHGPV